VSVEDSPLSPPPAPSWGSHSKSTHPPHSANHSHSHLTTYMSSSHTSSTSTVRREREREGREREREGREREREGREAKDSRERGASFREGGGMGWEEMGSPSLVGYPLHPLVEGCQQHHPRGEERRSIHQNTSLWKYCPGVM